jgi:hypothetical protein
MKKIQSINVGKGKVVMYQNNNQFILRFEYGEDKNNIVFISSYGEILKEYLDKIGITDQRDDAVQFCFKLGDNVFKYFEYDYNERSLKEDIINCDKLTLEEKKEAICGFYSSLDEVNKIYGKDANQIIAECYFENSII